MKYTKVLILLSLLLLASCKETNPLNNKPINEVTESLLKAQNTASLKLGLNSNSCYANSSLFAKSNPSSNELCRKNRG